MKFTPTEIAYVVLIEPEAIGDDRGFFMETWQARKFAAAGIDAAFVQDNHSRSRRGILRGLHIQPRHPQGKLVRVVAGEVFDVAVDLRKRSPTFGRWVGQTLSAENRHELWIPPGFAHGFYVRSTLAEVVYKVTDFYAPDDERTLRWDDKNLNIRWPLIDDAPPVLSARDAAGLTLPELERHL
jgi:dTDP-4-dehydrorhamnose 3,5-epimerase